MTFMWPTMLLALLVLPPIVGVYVYLQKRQRVLTNSFYGAAGGVAARRPSPAARYVPPLLFLLSLAIILIALARPQAEISLPRVEGTVMLVFDVSASMGADDVEPTRLEAAKAAAREFVLSRPTTVQIGIVSFSGSGFTVQTPTNDAGALLSTINRLEPTSGTSLGQGILTALHAIAVDAGLATDSRSAAPQPAETKPSVQEQTPAMSQEALLARLPDGNYPASVIVLLSDGENTESIDPIEAAQAAAAHAVRVDALGFGTTAGATLKVDGYTVHTALDEGALQQTTQAAFGTYYPGHGEQDRQEVYDNLTPQLVVKTQRMEITSIFAGAAILAMLAGCLLAMMLFNRMP